jgi:hypothetical protein
MVKLKFDGCQCYIDYVWVKMNYTRHCYVDIKFVPQSREWDGYNAFSSEFSVCLSIELL